MYVSGRGLAQIEGSGKKTHVLEEFLQPPFLVHLLIRVVLVQELGHLARRAQHGVLAIPQLFRERSEAVGDELELGVALLQINRLVEVLWVDLARAEGRSAVVVSREKGGKRRGVPFGGPCHSARRDRPRRPTRPNPSRPLGSSSCWREAWRSEEGRCQGRERRVRGEGAGLGRWGLSRGSDSVSNSRTKSSTSLSKRPAAERVKSRRRSDTRRVPVDLNLV